MVEPDSDNDWVEFEHFGQQLKVYRKTFGLSQQEMADLCGKCLNTYSEWERLGKGLSEMKYRKAVKTFQRLLLKEKGIVFEEYFSNEKVFKGVESVIRKLWGLK